MPTWLSRCVIPIIVAMIVLLTFALIKLVHNESVDPQFELIGRVEGCNVYHQPGPYGGSAFAVCHP